MASQSSTSMSPDSEIVEEIAAELGISSAFVEKDWYSVQALKEMNLESMCLQVRLQGFFVLVSGLTYSGLYS